MSTSLDTLFSPFHTHQLTLPNRVVMAPMTRNFSPGGVPTADVAAYYRRRAEGGVGLIITEGTGVERPAALNSAGYPNFHGEAALAGWKTVVEAVHAAGGRIAPQLWHVGGSKGRDRLGRIDMPSQVERPGYDAVEPMSDKDVADTIAAFARAAADAKRIGFDAVELHGAHGYLIDQFFWDATNQRNDRWGGATLPERSRFAVEIVRAVRKAIGPDFPLILRVSQWKTREYGFQLAPTPREMEDWLQPLADAGVDIFHASQRRFWEPEFDGSTLNFAGWVKKLTSKPTITVGSVGLSGEFIGAFKGEGSQAQSIDALLERLNRGEFDLVAVGRALLHDWEWLRKVQSGRSAELRDFDAKSLETLY